MAGKQGGGALRPSSAYKYRGDKDGLGYNPLFDRHLEQYYADKSRRKTLQRVGRVTKKGVVLAHDKIDRKQARHERRERRRLKEDERWSQEISFAQTKQRAERERHRQQAERRARVAMQRRAEGRADSESSEARPPQPAGRRLPRPLTAEAVRTYSAPPQRSDSLRRALGSGGPPRLAASLPRPRRPASAIFSRSLSSPLLRRRRAKPAPTSHVRMVLRYHGITPAAGYQHVASHYPNPTDGKTHAAARPRRRSVPQQLRVSQNVPGLPSTTLFDAAVHEGDIVSLVSHRKGDVPFSLTVYKDNLKWQTLSACCEYHYRHGKASRLGGATGILSLIDLSGGRPCPVCRARRRAQGHYEDGGAGRDEDGSSYGEEDHWSLASSTARSDDQGSNLSLADSDDSARSRKRAVGAGAAAVAAPPSDDDNSSFYDSEDDNEGAEQPQRTRPRTVAATPASNTHTPAPAAAKGRAKRPASAKAAIRRSGSTTAGAAQPTPFELLKARLEQKEEARAKGFPSLRFTPALPPGKGDSASLKATAWRGSRRAASCPSGLGSPRGQKKKKRGARGQGDGADTPDRTVFAERHHAPEPKPAPIKREPSTPRAADHENKEPPTVTAAPGAVLDEPDIQPAPAPPRNAASSLPAPPPLAASAARAPGPIEAARPIVAAGGSSSSGMPSPALPASKPQLPCMQRPSSARTRGTVPRMASTHTPPPPTASAPSALDVAPIHDPVADDATPPAQAEGQLSSVLRKGPGSRSSSTGSLGKQRRVSFNEDIGVREYRISSRIDEAGDELGVVTSPVPEVHLEAVSDSVVIVRQPPRRAEDDVGGTGALSDSEDSEAGERYADETELDVEQIFESSDDEEVEETTSNLFASANMPKLRRRPSFES